MKKVSIITLGCKVNLVESERLAEKLEQNGFIVTMGLGESDIYVINSCAVTNEADRKSRNYIAKILKINSDAKIYVCGCSSTHNPDAFKKGAFVKAVVGNENKMTLADTIIKENADKNSIETKPYKAHQISRTRADLWIQNGCNNFCTYCLIPYIRGREVSFPLDEIKKEIENLQMQTNEIVITGINMSAYGKDIEGSDGLIEVARLFSGKKVRFRFSSLEVNVITEKFLNELAGFENFCPHFHLSLQSGSNNTLKAMNRHYTKEQYKQKVDLIRKVFPNAGITTDIIIGFPTETDEDFLESLQFAKSVEFSDMHIFPYSKRDGTVASKMKVIAKNVPERVKQMTDLANQMKEEFLKKNLGREFEVIIENKKGDYYLAHTANFILCYVRSSDELKSNEIVTVKLEKLYLDGAVAKIVAGK